MKGRDTGLAFQVGLGAMLLPLFLTLIVATNGGVWNGEVVRKQSVICNKNTIQFEMEPSLPSYVAPYGLLYIEPIQSHPDSCVAMQGKALFGNGFPALPTYLSSECNFNWTQIGATDFQEVWNSQGSSAPRQNFTSYIDCLVPTKQRVQAQVNVTQGNGGYLRRSKREVPLISGEGNNVSAWGPVFSELRTADDQYADVVDQGTPLVFRLHLNETEMEYNTSIPWNCWIGNGDEASNLHFIKNGCPNTALISAFRPLSSVTRNPNYEMDGSTLWSYELRFRAFAMRDEDSEGFSQLQITCDVRLCLEYCPLPQVWSYELRFRAFAMRDEDSEGFSQLQITCDVRLCMEYCRLPQECDGSWGNPYNVTRMG